MKAYSLLILVSIFVLLSLFSTVTVMNVFVALGVFPFLLELLIFLTPYGYYSKRRIYIDEFLPRLKADEIQKLPLETRKEGMSFILNQLKYFIWAIIGVFTSLQYFFVALFLLSLLMKKLDTKENSIKAQITLIRIDSLISLLIIAALIYYHFANLQNS